MRRTLAKVSFFIKILAKVKSNEVKSVAFF